MGFIFRKDTDEKILKRLSVNAGHVIEMIKAYCNTPNGVDARKALVFSAALAGHSCHQAVIAEHGTFAEVTDKNGNKYYFGDDLNKYLIENKMSVVGFCMAVSDVSGEEMISIVKKFAEQVGDENHTVCGYDIKSLYEQVNSCWNGIYDNMTSKYCKTSSEWPILFGLVLQNILLMSIKAGAPKKEAGEMAIECAVAMSKIGDGSSKA